MTKSEMRTLGSGSNLNTESKATELTDNELDQVTGGLKMSDPKTSGDNNLIVYDDLSKAKGYTHTGDDLWVTGITNTDLGSGR
jgi:bacteriocin-like protein